MLHAIALIIWFIGVYFTHLFVQDVIQDMFLSWVIAFVVQALFTIVESKALEPKVYQRMPKQKKHIAYTLFGTVFALDYATNYFGILAYISASSLAQTNLFAQIPLGLQSIASEIFLIILAFGIMFFPELLRMMGTTESKN